MDDGVITFPTKGFEEDHPPDAPGQEAAEHARVWKVYREERTAYEEKTLDGWNKLFDILLTFAGLYSAALTAFLVESVQKLEEDPTEYLADVVFQILSSPSAGSSTNIRPDNLPIRRLGDGFTIATSDRIVNVLWFSSLAITLSVALLCILAKQWIGAYELLVLHKGAPTALYWSRRHVFYHEDLRKWRVPALVTVLPMMLHVALFLFLVGLCLWLVPQDFEIALVVTVIVAVVLGFYVVQALLPVWIPTCAWRTPLSRGIHLSLASLRQKASNWMPDDEPASVSTGHLPVSLPRMSQVMRLLVLLWDTVLSYSPCARRTRSSRGSDLSPLTLGRSTTNWMHTDDVPAIPPATPPAPTHTHCITHVSRIVLRAAKSLVLACCPRPSYEGIGIDDKSPYFDAQVVKWLLMSSTRNVSAVAVQAIGAISPVTPACDQLRKLDRTFLQEYLQARSRELADIALSRSDRAMDERVHCLRAWVLSGLVGLDSKQPIPFSRAIADHRPGDAAIMNLLASCPYNALSGEPAGGLLSIFRQLAADDYRICPSLPALLLTLEIVSSWKQPSLSRTSPDVSCVGFPLPLLNLRPDDHGLMRWNIETEVAVLIHSVHAMGQSSLRDPILQMTARYLGLWLSSRVNDLYHLHHRDFQPFLSADHGMTLEPRIFIFGFSIELASMPNILALDPLEKRALHRGLIWFAHTIIVSHSGDPTGIKTTLPHARASLAFLSSDIVGSYLWSSDDLADLMELLRLVPRGDVSDLVSRLSAVVQLLRYAAGSQLDGMRQKSDALWLLVLDTLSSILGLELGGKSLTPKRDLRNLLSPHVPHIAHSVFLCTQLSPERTARAIRGVLSLCNSSSRRLEELSVLDLVANTAHIRVTLARRVLKSVDWMAAYARYQHDISYGWVEPGADAVLAIPRASVPLNVGAKQSSPEGACPDLQLMTYVPAAQRTMYEIFSVGDIERCILEEQREDDRVVEAKYSKWETSGETHSTITTTDTRIPSLSPGKVAAEGGKAFLKRATPMEGEEQTRAEPHRKVQDPGYVDRSINPDPVLSPDAEDEPVNAKAGKRAVYFANFLDSLSIDLDTASLRRARHPSQPLL